MHFTENPIPACHRIPASLIIQLILTNNFKPGIITIGAKINELRSRNQKWEKFTETFDAYHITN